MIKNAQAFVHCSRFFFSFKYFSPRPQYFDYFHMKLFDGILFRVSVN